MTLAEVVVVMVEEAVIEAIAAQLHPCTQNKSQKVHRGGQQKLATRAAA